MLCFRLHLSACWNLEALGVGVPKKMESLGHSPCWFRLRYKVYPRLETLTLYLISFTSLSLNLLTGSHRSIEDRLKEFSGLLCAAICLVSGTTIPTLHLHTANRSSKIILNCRQPVQSTWQQPRTYLLMGSCSTAGISYGLMPLPLALAYPLTDLFPRAGPLVIPSSRISPVILELVCLQLSLPRSLLGHKKVVQTLLPCSWNIRIAS